MRASLAALGHHLSHKRVWPLMKAAGLRGRHPKAWRRTTIGADQPANAPDLLGRDFSAERPNEKWCGDITHVKTWDGWAYLATVIDLHSRAVIGWAIADHMRAELVTAALDMAIARRRPPAGVVFHSAPRRAVHVWRIRSVLQAFQDKTVLGAHRGLLRQCRVGIVLRDVTRRS
jgi:transposase InsO family protein